MKYTKYIGMMIVAGGMLAATSCTDFSDYNSVPGSAQPSAENTLWENINAKSELSDFAAVLKRVGYDKVLSESHTYTVWAPVNGSFKLDSLAEISDEKVLNQFVKNHIANYSHMETDIADSVVFMLNEKILPFRAKGTSAVTFGGKSLIADGSVYNHPSLNGTLYVMKNPTEFRYNGYEVLGDLAGVADEFSKYVRKYETSRLDETKSVKGEIRDGVQHYDDSVMIVSNSFVTRTLGAQLDNEDSLYTVLIPTNKAWENIHKEVKSLYNYITPISYQNLSKAGMKVGGTCPTTATGNATIMDANVGTESTSLQAAPADAEITETAPYWTDSIAKRLITNRSTFSETNKRYNAKLATGERFVENDTLYSTNRYLCTNLPYLDEVTENIIPLSNGHARIINAYPFLAEDTYAPVIRTRNVSRIVTASGSSHTRVSVSNLPSSVVTFEDDVDDGVLRYEKAVLPSASNAAPEMDFYLNNVLSTTYDIYAVIVPGWIDNHNYTTGEDNEGFVRKPYTLRFDINYTDASNTQIAGRFDGEGIITKVTDMKKVPAFLVAEQKIDTVKLGRVNFPICYAGTEAKPNIKVMNTIATFNATNKRKYEQELRVANIILRPVEKNEEEKNATKED